MALFSLENDFDKALRMDGPISKGPTMRWQRKLNESSGNSSSLTSNGSLLQMNSSLGGKSPAKLRRSLSLSSIQTKENNSNKSTPSRRSRTPGRFKTPTKQSAASGDRFIPNRFSTDFESAHHRASQNHLADTKPADTANSDVNNLKKEEFERVMSANLNGEQPSAKILAFRQKAPAAPEGHLNNLRVLYSQHKTPSSTAKKTARHIPSAPERILDAPDLLDDFYLNLLSWSSGNLLAVALGCRLYVWNATSGDIAQLMELDETEYISSVSWVKEGSFLAVGTSTGEVQIWDSAHKKKLRSMFGQESRVGSLAWNSHLLSSGSRSGTIHQHDVRVAEHLVGVTDAHIQEVCGLEWSPDGKYLASGGNDNMLNVWSDNFSLTSTIEPVYTFNQHQAAVKAIAWCPWQPSLLASGGGTADRCLKFWNCNTGVCLNSVDTKSQVCSVLWSQAHQELITSHGYPDHHLCIWKYPTMSRVADLMGHSARVLHTAMSPDGTTVVSGAADETLRLWKCFAIDPKKAKKAAKPVSVPFGRGIR
ncbi:cell division cycle protein 20 homolog [Watersipora subatra]|uniref:cell division cycle protein 20 homolog n=1 Tax=Watersipora subatra TaxID=2589382 RepID=UPI00355AD8A1